MRRSREARRFHPCLLLAALLFPVHAAAQHPGADPSPGEPRVVRASEVAAPASGEMTQATVHESGRMVSRIMRLAPDAAIAEHHHPLFDETFVVQRGGLTLVLDDRAHELQAGDVVYIPAGTVISGRNTGGKEAVVVVTWANVGRPGALTVPGRPAAHH